MFCFQADWMTAMPVETFMHFKQSFEQDAITTLKRFGLLVCQLCKFWQKDNVAMQKLIRPQPIALLRTGFEVAGAIKLWLSCIKLSR